VIAVPTRAARLPGPPELLPGRPDAVVDLQTAGGVALVGGEWRYSDCRVEEIEFVELGSPEDPLGPGTVPNRTYDVVPHGEAADYDDSGWRALAPEETMLRLANGRVCFNWYRIAVTIPQRVGEFDAAGATVVFETVVDDYAEVWVNGALPFALGDSGGHVAAGFNAPNRVVLTRDARPGDRFVIAVFGINGPISASPRNYIWMRTASLDFYAPERARVGEDAPFEAEGELPLAGGVEAIAGGFDGIDAVLPAPDGAILFASSGTIYRWRDGVVTVFRAKSDAAGLAFSPDGLLTIAQRERGRILRVNPHGDTTVLRDGLDDPRAVAYEDNGDLLVHPPAIAFASRYAVDGEGILTIDRDGGVDVLCDFDDEPRGIAVDEHGRLYVAGAGGVSLLSAEGDRLGALRLSERPRSLAFAGDTLYIGGDTTLFQVRLTTKGAS
jgi:gluconolactonase